MICHKILVLFLQIEDTDFKQQRVGCLFQLERPKLHLNYLRLKLNVFSPTNKLSNTN